MIDWDTQFKKDEQNDGWKHKLVLSSWCKFVLEKEVNLKENKIYNTALYCRLSLDDGNVGESGSIQTQKIILEEYAKSHNFKIYGTYVDDGYSGLNFAEVR